MKRQTIAFLAAAGTLVVLACMIPPRAGAQTIARRVAGVKDGKVRMSFAARPDICGFDNGISNVHESSRNSNRSSWSSTRSEDVQYDNDCSEGPVRVVAQFQSGSLQRIRTYVGGRWREGSGVTDLGTVPVKEATDFLLGIARTGSGKAAGEAIFPVTLADSIEPAQPIYSIARDASRPVEVRDQAIFWLSQVDDDRAVGMLNDILRSSSNPQIQDKAIFGLSQHRSGKGIPVLREFAERDGASDELRGKAIFWLGQSGTSGGQYLRSLYDRVHSADLKDKIIFAMSQQHDAASQRWLMDIVSNPSEDIEVRKKALFWAGQTGVPVQELSALYSRMSEREMKDQMIFVFSQRQERAAIDKLMDIAKNDSDREARRKAMFWLGQSRDARVSAFLADMINR
jgi:HEAT repeat protein